MQTLYLCTSRVRRRHASNPTLQKYGRLIFQCEVWSADEDQARIVAEQTRESEYSSTEYDHFDFSCEAQIGVTIEGNIRACEETGKAYEVLPNGLVKRDT
jgi:hypothetical protein